MFNIFCYFVFVNLFKNWINYTTFFFFFFNILSSRSIKDWSLTLTFKMLIFEVSKTKNQ